jgi:hypothetical protein
MGGLGVREGKGREGGGDYSLASDVWISHPNEPSTTILPC